MTDHTEPGSPEAIQNGCTCPVLDNHNGEGQDGAFWINAECPVHVYTQRSKGDQTND